VIFISYSWTDSRVARALNECLANAGVTTWIDFLKLDIAAPLEPQIRRAVTAASRMLLVESSDSRSSGWVKRELVWAECSGVPIMSWRVSSLAEDLEFGMRRKNWINMPAGLAVNSLSAGY
jgi:hypothetical protein